MNKIYDFLKKFKFKRLSFDGHFFIDYLCPNYGNKVRKGEKFCMKCGYEL